MRVNLDRFGGEIPRREKHLLNDWNADVAINCKLWSGALQPMRGLLERNDPTKVGTIRTIYRYAKNINDDSGGFFLHWTEDVDVVQAAIADDTEERLYWSGEGAPKMSYASIITAGGGTNYPTNSYLLGVPAPSSAPTLVVSGDADEGLAVDSALDLSYSVCYLSAKGELGPPSTPSDAKSYLAGQTRTLSDLPVAPAGNYNITEKVLYRTVLVNARVVRKLVAVLPIAQTDYVDDVEILGDELVSDFYFPPPDDLQSLGIMDNGIYFGFSNKGVYFSEPYLAHAWNPFNTWSSTVPIVGVGVLGNRVVAITQEDPVIISGYSASNLVASRFAIGQGGVSKRGIVSGPYGVVYPSKDGLVLINGSNAPALITNPYFSRDDWQALDPTTTLGVLHDDKYFCFYDDGVTPGGFILDPQDAESGLVRTDIHATGAYHDPVADDLYLVVDNKIQSWDRGNALTYRWRSKEFIFDRETTWNVGRVIADSYDDLTFRVFVDGVLRGEKVITADIGAEPFYIRGAEGYCGKIVQFELEGTDLVRQAGIANDLGEFV
jgi:hypothetical protein